MQLPKCSTNLSIIIFSDNSLFIAKWLGNNRSSRPKNANTIKLAQVLEEVAAETVKRRLLIDWLHLSRKASPAAVKSNDWFVFS